MKRPAGSMTGKNSLQQQIATMLGDRVRKPRPFNASQGPPAKRQKLQDDTNPPTVAAPVPATPSAVPPTQDPHASIQSQKRKWRLAEIVKLDREARRLKSMSAPPAFVLLPTNSNSSVEAIPSPASTRGLPSVSSTPSSSPTTTPKKNRVSGVAKRVTFAKESLDTSPCPGSSSTSLKVNLPGAEAIHYDRERLPKSHSLLLDVLTSMESALSLLRTRKASSTVGSIRDIVQKDTKRNFTLRMLSQLAHIVPECVAVLSGCAVTTRHKRPSDNLVVRLDDPYFGRTDNDKSGTTKRPDASVLRDSILGDSAARVRRSMLHKRLLQHVQEQHKTFLRDRSLSWGGISWHPDFDLEQDVEDLPAPPLYVEKPQRPQLPGPTTKYGEPRNGLKSFETQVVQSEKVAKAEVAEDTPTESSKDSVEVDDYDIIPKSLLARVRSREKSRNEHETKVEEERVSNRSLVSKLPCTMDTVSNVLRTERRSAIGWKQLINKVAAMHPRKWDKDDIERQLDAIVKVATDWCKKVQLQSSSGGFAFRVISEKAFASARAKVCAADSVVLD